MKRVVYDTETDHLLDKLTTVHSLVLKCLDTGKVLSCANQPGYTPIDEGLRILEEAELRVAHNGIRFDEPAIGKVHSYKPKGTLRDTLVLSRLIRADSGDHYDRDWKLVRKGKMPKQLAGRHSLESWGYRLGKWKGDYAVEWTKKAKEQGIKAADEVHKFVWGTWRPEMQSYCEQDVEVTFDLYNLLKSKLDNGWSEECVELEHSVAWIIARQERYGFAFDEEKAGKYYATLVDHSERLVRALEQTFKPREEIFIPKSSNKKYGYQKGVPVKKLIPFNPKSRKQAAERLIELGWEPDEYGKDGVPKLSDDVLQLLPWPEAKMLAEYQMVQKRMGALSTGKEAWLKHVKNGRIHGEVVTNGAVTGRMTHKKPNIAQVPSLHNKKTGEKQPYGKESRELFVATKGKKLVGCDADALELRDLAGYMARYDAGAYIQTVLSGKKEDGTDMHSVNARALGGVHREIAKRWFYAFIYGAGDYKLGLILGATGSYDKIAAAGKKSKRDFMRGLPALAKLVKAVQAKAKAQGWIRGLDGRKLRIRALHAALNTLLQSAGAIQMKRALVILDNELQAEGLVPGVHYEFVANVHDEWQIEVNEDITDKVGKMAADAIRKAGEHYNFRCPLAGNYEVGSNWAETH